LTAKFMSSFPFTCDSSASWAYSEECKKKKKLPCFYRRGTVDPPIFGTSNQRLLGIPLPQLAREFLAGSIGDRIRQ